MGGDGDGVVVDGEVNGDAELSAPFAPSACAAEEVGDLLVWQQPAEHRRAKPVACGGLDALPQQEATIGRTTTTMAFGAGHRRPPCR